MVLVSEEFLEPGMSWGLIPCGQPFIELRDSFRYHITTYSCLKDLQEHCQANLEF